MRLDAGFSHGQLVNVPAKSSGVAIDRVEPGKSSQSFLVHFINGTPTSVGYTGSQTQMAPSGQPNSTSKASITTWINGGAIP
jgi:hypothetical protein